MIVFNINVLADQKGLKGLGVLDHPLRHAFFTGLRYRTLNLSMEAARGYHQTQQYHRAQTAYQSLLLEKPQNAKLWYLLGCVQYQLGNTSSALQSLEQVGYQSSCTTQVTGIWSRRWLCNRNEDSINTCWGLFWEIQREPSKYYR